VRVDISLDDFPLDVVGSTPPDRERPTRRGLALAAVFAVLLGLVAVQARHPARSDLQYAYDGPPPVPVAVVRSGRGYFTMDTGAHEFTYVVPMTSTTTWPVTVTEVRLDLPAGLRAAAEVAVVDVPPPGRAAARLSMPIELMRYLSVQITVRLVVDCRALPAIRAVPGRVVVVALVGDRPGETDLMSDLVMFGHPWTVTLAGTLCTEVAATPSTGPSDR
jgi:hypothetical protein